MTRIYGVRQFALALAVITLAVFGLSLCAGSQTADTAKVTTATAKAPAKPQDTSTAAPSTPLSSHKVVVYYFHGTKRCVSCRKIEAYTKEAIDSAFAKELASGTLEWKVINTDSSQNEHFLTDYELYTKSVVVSELQGGKQIRWKNLTEVWELLNDQDGFHKYIRTELVPFLYPKP